MKAILTYYNRYGFGGFLRLLFSKLFTVIFFPRSKIIRLPVDIRNKPNIDFGYNLTCGRYCRFEVHPNRENRNVKLLVFGTNVQVNDFVHIVAVNKVTIGNNVLIASKVFISDSNHGNYRGELQSNPEQIPIDRDLEAQPVEIGDNVWIGEFVSILPGTKIGKGSIIGTMSVVAKDIPAYCIAVGAPAKVIKTFNFETGKWERV